MFFSDNLKMGARNPGTKPPTMPGDNRMSGADPVPFPRLPLPLTSLFLSSIPLLILPSSLCREVAPSPSRKSWTAMSFPVGSGAELRPQKHFWYILANEMYLMTIILVADLKRKAREFRVHYVRWHIDTVQSRVTCTYVKGLIYGAAVARCTTEHPLY